MITVMPLYLQAKWLDNEGGFLVWGNKTSGHFLDPVQLKWHLFAWHEPSFYGTAIELGSVGRLKGIRLPARLALDTLQNLRGNPLLEIDCDETLDTAIAWTGRLANALRAGAFLPDYERRAAGKPGWRIRGGDPEDGADGSSVAWTPVPDALTGWVSALLRETATGEEERRRLDRLARDWSGLEESDAAGSFFADETEWLAELGWTEDPCPFRVCLRIEEPSPEEPEDEWRLEIVLVDRAEPARELGFSPAAAPELPVSWAPYVDRIDSAMRQWLRHAPMLRDESSALQPAVRASLTGREAWIFLSDTAMTLAEEGATVLLPAWWRQMRTLRPKLKASVHSPGASHSLFGLEQLVNFDWQIAIGDLQLTEREFRDLIEEERQMIRVSGRWFRLDAQALGGVRDELRRIGRRQGMTLSDMLSLYLSDPGTQAEEDGEEPADVDQAEAAEEDDGASAPIRVHVELDRRLREWVRRLQRSEGVPMETAPEGFRGELRHYQREGMSWLLFLRRSGFGACLADDMGLGKTIQTIAYLLKLRESEKPVCPSLLICPTSVLGNWQKELHRFAPELKVFMHYGPNRIRDAAEFSRLAGEADVVLSTYTLANLDRKLFTGADWDTLVLDEAQYVKNAQTKQAAAVRRIPRLCAVALTGTPIENRLSDLWSIFQVINPGYLGSSRSFNERFARPIERGKDDERTGVLRRLVRPFLLRRSKSDKDVELDLPDKIESKEYVTLTKEQIALYEEVVDSLFGRIEGTSALARKGRILAALTALKQVLCHPALYRKEPLPELGGAAEVKHFAERSSKTARLLDMLDEIRGIGESCLIFTQYAAMGRILRHLLSAHTGEPVLFLHGGTPQAARVDMIDLFQQRTDARIFVLSLKAGGTGLNLTAANHVIHYDRWWNPAVENQATDRAHRIGQQRSVQVHKFVSLGTLEENVDELIDQKERLSGRIMASSGEQWITELSTDNLRRLFVLRNDWADGR